MLSLGYYLCQCCMIFLQQIGMKQNKIKFFSILHIQRILKKINVFTIQLLEKTEGENQRRTTLHNSTLDTRHRKEREKTRKKTSKQTNKQTKTKKQNKTIQSKLETQLAELVSLIFHSALWKLNTEPSIGASYQISVHLVTQFQRKIFFRNRPIRSKNCQWWPCL